MHVMGHKGQVLIFFLPLSFLCVANGILKNSGFGDLFIQSHELVSLASEHESGVLCAFYFGLAFLSQLSTLWELFVQPWYESCHLKILQFRC